MRPLIFSFVSASSESPPTNATPMLSHRAVTVPPSELTRASPSAGIEEVSLNITTVFPVGIPLMVLSAVRGEDAMDELDVTAVGASEHALRISAAGTTITDHRARLAPIDIFFFLPLGSSILP